MRNRDKFKNETPANTASEQLEDELELELETEENDDDAWASAIMEYADRVIWIMGADLPKKEDGK